MSTMMHRNCSLGCCLAGSRFKDREAVRREIEMELDVPEPTYHDYDSDPDYLLQEYWGGVEYYSTKTGDPLRHATWESPDW